MNDREFNRLAFEAEHPIAHIFFTITEWALTGLWWLFLAALFIRLVGWVFHG